MSLPKRKSRKITVEGIDYRWAESVTIADGANGSWLNLTIEGQAAKTKRIYARCALRWDRNGERDKIVMPRNVAAVIRYAVENGWDPISTKEDYHVADFDRIAGDMRHPACDQAAESAVRRESNVPSASGSAAPDSGSTR